jgi:hypothetical protein
MTTEETKLPDRRRDEELDWHDILPTACPDCGCVLFYARDDADILWEPGPAWDEGCRDRDCHCHTQPLLGQRRG